MRSLGGLADLAAGAEALVHPTLGTQRGDRVAVAVEPLAIWRTTGSSGSMPSAASDGSWSARASRRRSPDRDPPSAPATRHPPREPAASDTSAVRRLPRCSGPVGEGAKRPRIGPVSPSGPSRSRQVRRHDVPKKKHDAPAAGRGRMQEVERNAGHGSAAGRRKPPAPSCANAHWPWSRRTSRRRRSCCCRSRCWSARCCATMPTTLASAGGWSRRSWSARRSRCSRSTATTCATDVELHAHARPEC